MSSINARVAVLIFLAGFAAYSNSFHVPFIFDDIHTIANNYALRDLSRPFEAVTATSPGRPFLMFTFALNYATGGVDTFGYHVTNFLIHLATAWLVYVSVAAILRREDVVDGRLMAGVGAMYFLLHPLNVEAVTYVCSRSDSLSTMLYMAVFYLYVARPFRPVVNAAFSGTLFLLAMLTKEVPATLPAILTVYSFQFMDANERRRSRRELGMLWVILPLVFIIRSAVTGHPLEETNPRHVSPLVYFLTQLKVVGLLYLPKLLVPVNLVFDGWVGWKRSLLDAEVMAGAAILLLLVGYSVYGFRRNRVLSFSILWFLSALTVTSTFLPIYDPYYERRLYAALPAVGLAVAWLVWRLWVRYPDARKLTAALLAVTLTVYGAATYKRNSLYIDPLVLWEDTLVKGMEKDRIYAGIAMEYLKRGNYDRAEAVLERGFKTYPDEIRLKIAYCWALGAQSKFGKMEEVLDGIVPETKTDRAQVLNFRGLIAGERKDYAGAMKLFRESLELYPDYVDPRANIGLLLAREGKREEAVAWLEESARKHPHIADYRFQIGNIMLESDKARAEMEFREAIRLDPDHALAKKALIRNFGHR